MFSSRPKRSGSTIPSSAFEAIGTDIIERCLQVAFDLSQSQEESRIEQAEAAIEERRSSRVKIFARNASPEGPLFHGGRRTYRWFVRLDIWHILTLQRTQGWGHPQWCRDLRERFVSP
jgi:hypothetical protein